MQINKTAYGMPEHVFVVVKLNGKPVMLTPMYHKFLAVLVAEAHTLNHPASRWRSREMWKIIFKQRDRRKGDQDTYAY